MKAKLLFKITTILILIHQLSILNSFAQEVPFTPPLNNSSNLTIRGDMKIIANAITGLSGDQSGTGNSIFSGDITDYNPNDPYNGNASNDRLTQDYIDIDNDDTTFSSSSADFISGVDCPKVAYAGLYWSATYYVDRVDAASGNNSPQLDNLPVVDSRPDFRTVKLKLPGASNYIDVNVESGDNGVVYDGYRNTPTNPNDIASNDIPYVCYADVTEQLQALSNPDGTYTVANVRATTGLTSAANGISGGWTMVIIYEAPSLTKKQFITQHGFLEVNSGNPSKTFEFTGFQTPPAPNDVRARFGIAALEGDFGLVGDVLGIQAAPLGDFDIPLFSDPVNGSTNFFNSSISVDGAYNTARNPSSENTLGFDVDTFDVPNVGNSVIGNSQNSLVFTAKTEGDSYRIFLNTLSIEVVDPELTGFSRVLDVNGVDITGGDLQFGQDFFYEFTIQNTGNENLTNTSITSAIADNVDFVQGTLITPSGVTAIYNNANREVVFRFDDSVVERLDPELTFRFGVRVVDSCQDLRDTCKGDIDNTLLISYTGQVSGITASETELSEPASCSFTLPAPPNFLDTSGDCDQEFSALICSGTVDIVAESGFAQYIWTDLSTNTVIATVQILTVSGPGMYKVDKTGNPDCFDQTEIWTVNEFSSAENPVIAVVNDPLVNGNIQTCAITGEFLPEIFLCGSGTEQYIDSGFINTTSIIWERLDPVACPAVIREEGCPTLDIACDPDWVQVSATRDFTVAEAGEYRIRIEFEGGCIQDFYFNVFKSDYDFNVEVVQNITCDAEGAIRVVNASGEYEYQLVTPEGTIIPYQVSPEFSGLIEEGEYLINARQSNGLPTACTFQSNAVLIKDVPASIALVAGGDSCYDFDGASQWITITGGEAPYTYRLNGNSPVNVTFLSSPPSSSNTFEVSGLIPGSYNIEVVGANNCISNTIAFIIEPTLTIAASLIKNLDCSANPDALIETTITGGNGENILEYNINGSGYTPYSGSFPFSTSIAGIYEFRVTDSEGCQSVSAGIALVRPLDLAVSTMVNDASCNGLSDGSVVITVDNSTGVAPYEIDFNGQGFSNKTIYGNLTTGAYEYTVRDSNGCVQVFNVVIGEPTPIAIGSENNIDIVCNAISGNTLGSIDLSNITGGVPPYTYSLLNSDNSLATTSSVNPTGPTTINSITFNDLEYGNYTVKVEDFNGCVYEYDYSIQTVPIFTITESSTASCVDGVVMDINVLGGTGPFEIREYPSGTFVPLNGLPVSSGFPQRNHQYRNFPFGIPFTFEIIDLATGCSDIRESIPVVSPSTIDIQVVENNVSCYGSSDGFINYTITGYQGTELTYEIFKVSDITVDVSSNYIFGNGNPDAVIASGTTINTIEGFGPGDYILNVIETDGAIAIPCNAAVQFRIEEPSELNLVETSSVFGNCNNFAEVIVNGQGGTPPYTYAVVIDGSAPPLPEAYTTNNILSLDQSIGLSWDVYVLDTKGCEFGVLDVNITETTNPLFTSVPTSVDDPCTFDNNYTFTVVAIGESQLAFGIDDGDAATSDLPVYVNGFPTGNTNEYSYTYIVTSPSVDQYTLSVRDVNGCIDTESIKVYEELIINAQVTIEPTCIEDNGEITVTVSGGSDYTVNPGNFTFSLIDAITNTVIASQQQSNIFTNVVVGNYTVEVTDMGINSISGCVVTDTLTISAPALITADVAITQEYICTASGTQFGEITVMNPIGGNGNYEYSIDGVDFSNTSSVFTGLTSGTYSIFIRDTDTASCPINIGTITIDPIQEISIDSITTTDGLCNGDDGSATFVVGGINLANNSYSYEVTTSNIPAIVGTNISNSPVVLTNLFPGVYNINVTNDNTGCSYDDTFVINESSPIQANITSLEEINCENAEAMIIVDVSGGTPPYEFSIDNVNYTSSNTLTFIEGGIYTAYVRDSNGCIVTLNVTIMEGSDLEVALDLSNTEIICYGQATGSIDAMATGGTDNYLYAVSGTNYLGEQVNNGTQSTSLIRNLLAGDYTYTVTNGSCSESVPFTIIQPADFVVSIEQEDVTTCNGIENGSITVIATGGTAPYFYSLYDNGGNPLFTFLEDDIDGIAGQHIFDSLVPGIYRVETEDSNGCPETVSDIVISQSAVDIAVSVTPVSTNDDGIIEVTATGGIGGYTYELLDATGDSVIIPSQNSNILIVNTAGDYIVKVIDSNGCFYFKEVTVETTEDNPIVEYADEILFCALTGQSYPVINIENENGEVVDLSFTNVASILWQQLDEINCNVSFEENCPTIDDSCSSDWFDFQTGSSCTITEPGQYRVVITFNAKSGQNTKIYYFRADANLLDVEDVSISKINLYPNPSNTIVNINTEVRSIRVFDISGKIVLETTQKSFDISGLENGVYFTEIESTTGGVKIIKLLKK